MFQTALSFLVHDQRLCAVAQYLPVGHLLPVLLQVRHVNVRIFVQAHHLPAALHAVTSGKPGCEAPAIPSYSLEVDPAVSAHGSNDCVMTTLQVVALVSHVRALHEPTGSRFPRRDRQDAIVLHEPNHDSMLEAHKSASTLRMLWHACRERFLSCSHPSE